MGIFNFMKKKETKSPPLKNVFCMWKKTAQDPDSDKSKIVKLITKIYDVSEGYERLVFNALLYDKSKKIDALPEKQAFTGIEKGEIKILVGVSKDKGLRFFFDYDSTPLHEIEAFLTWALKLVEGLRSHLKQMKIDKPDEASNGKKWWAATKKQRKELGDQVAIGALVDLSQ